MTPKEPAGTKVSAARHASGGHAPHRRHAAWHLAAPIALLAALLMLLASCSSGPSGAAGPSGSSGAPPSISDAKGTLMEGTVTASAHGTSVQLGQALFCSTTDDGGLSDCAAGSGSPGHLTLPPGTPVTVKVSQRVGNAPWVIVFQYRDQQGNVQKDRTPVFAPGKRFSYRLTTPKHAQLTRLEVQTLTASSTKNGSVEFPATGSWVLQVSPPGGAGSTAAPSTAAPSSAAPSGASQSSTARSTTPSSATNG